MEESTKKRKLFKKLKNKYRLVILNDASFEEKFSYRLSPLNLFTLFLSITVLIISIVVVVIAFTPLRESIPGYTDVNLRKDLTEMVLKTDSMERKLALNQQYLTNVKLILSGGELDTLNQSAEQDLNKPLEEHRKIEKSKQDSLLRAYVEREDSYSLKSIPNEESVMSKLLFFTPLEGTLSNGYDLLEEHYGIDIVAPKNEAVKATLDGTVIFAEWTIETGYVIQLQHQNNLTSIYKHNSTLLKKIGDRVKAGEAIAIVGNSGELTSGPHLHFEIWQNGTAIDPTKYINFN